MDRLLMVSAVVVLLVALGSCVLLGSWLSYMTYPAETRRGFCRYLRRGL